MSKMPSELWKTIYDIQGEAQQAMENNRPCRSIEDIWDRLIKVLPMPYAAAPDLLEALEFGEDLISGDLVGVEWKIACKKFVSDARAAIAKAKGEDNV